MFMDGEQITLYNISHQLGILQGKLDAVILTQSAQGTQINALDKDVENLKQKAAWSMGVAAGVGAIVSFVGSAVIQLWQYLPLSHH